MRIGEKAIAHTSEFFICSVSDKLSRFVYAAHRRYNPNFISDTDFTVFPDISLKSFWGLFCLQMI
jgi:hypothetical protein